MKFVILRIVFFLGLWIPLAVWVAQYSLEEVSSTRFGFLLTSDGRVSTVQREGWFDGDRGVKSQDHILAFDGVPYARDRLKSALQKRKPDTYVTLRVNRGGEEKDVHVLLQEYSKTSLVINLFLPLLLSLIFLGFSIFLPLHRFSHRTSREAIEVFSVFCYSISILFLTYFPVMSLADIFPFIIGLPLCAVMLVHLFMVYPKKKGNAWIRIPSLLVLYGLVWSLLLVRYLHWQEMQNFWIYDFDVAFIGLSVVVSLISLGNTLLTSKDFWARRRARLMSAVSLFLFIAITGVFVAFVWGNPQISIERILAASLIFPSLFAVIFLKDDVFNLERVFRRGLHQMLLIGVAIIFATLVGLAWTQWNETQETDWMLWVAIATAVVLLSRPVGIAVELFFHRLIQTKVRYPDIENLFRESEDLNGFLLSLCVHFERHLQLENILIRLSLDPTKDWTLENEQRWLYRRGRLLRVYDEPKKRLVITELIRGGRVIGKLEFDGGDAIAFDPETSPDWKETVRTLSHFLELLLLREFVSTQEGFLAVGRMQSLIAHEMKNPLAIIKVCSGLLQNHTDHSEESEELIKTIQGEIERVSDSIQNIFNHSSEREEKQKVKLFEVIEGIRDQAFARFSNSSFETRLFVNGKEVPVEEEAIWLWVEKEGIRQSLSNLIINAYEGGSSTVRVVVEVGSRGFSIRVEDDGPGLPENMQLFKPFVTSKARGTGLGLSHVKAFMDRHQAQIHVLRRTDPSGTTFILEFSKQFVILKQGTTHGNNPDPTEKTTDTRR